MSQKKFAISLVLLLSLSIVIGCGAGSSATPTSLASPGDNGGGTTLPPPDGTGSGDGTTAATGVAALAWDAPAANVDGTPITDLAGYKIYYGKASRSYTGSIDAGKVTSQTINGLAPGTYYIAVTAYNAAGTESAYSNEVSKTVL